MKRGQEADEGIGEEMLREVNEDRMMRWKAVEDTGKERVGLMTRGKRGRTGGAEMECINVYCAF